MQGAVTEPGIAKSSPSEVLLVFLRLGLTSFGGPVAHLGYFHDEFVVRRRWLDERTYADLVALCQFLPGPASSQVGSRSVYRGPDTGGSGRVGRVHAAIGLGAGAVRLRRRQRSGGRGHGLAARPQGRGGRGRRQAVLGHGPQLGPDRQRATLAVAAAVVALAVPSAWGQVGAIVVGRRGR